MFSMESRTKTTLSHRAQVIDRIRVAASRQLDLVGARVADRVGKELRRLRPQQTPPQVVHRVLPGPTLSIRIEQGPETILRKRSKLSTMFSRRRKLFERRASSNLQAEASLPQRVLNRVLEHERKSGSLIVTFKDCL